LTRVNFTLVTGMALNFDPILLLFWFFIYYCCIWVWFFRGGFSMAIRDIFTRSFGNRSFVWSFHTRRLGSSIRGCPCGPNVLKFYPALPAREIPYPLGLLRDSIVPARGTSILNGGELIDMMSPLSAREKPPGARTYLLLVLAVPPRDAFLSSMAGGTEIWWCCLFFMLTTCYKIILLQLLLSFSTFYIYRKE